MELSLPAARASWPRAIFFFHMALAFCGRFHSVNMYPQGSHSQPRAKEEETRSTPTPRRSEKCWILA